MNGLKLYHLLLAMLAALAITGCDVHEFPDEEPTPPPGPYQCTLNLQFERDEFELHQNVVLGKDRSRIEDNPGSRDLRHIVRVYRLDDAASKNKGARVPSRYSFDYYVNTIADDGSHPDLSIPLELEAGEYDIIAWSDHVLPGATDDFYYSTDDFMEVRLLGAGKPGYAHQANDEYRVAWRGMARVIVGQNNEVSLADAPGKRVDRVEVSMERPMARYHFITNDLNEFIETENKHRASAEDSPGQSAPGQPAPAGPDLNDYKVVMRYTGYMPCAFNVLSDKPIDSATGVTYEGRIRAIDGNRAELAFDHVFVNHNETSVQVSLELYRRSDGSKLSSTGVIDVPLKRGRYTTVEGALLTTTYGTSMGVVPDFNGDYNIEIH